MRFELCRPRLIILILNYMRWLFTSFIKHIQMKTIRANQRTINIINKAIQHGFTFDENERLKDVGISAEKFLIENTKAIEVECDVKSLSNPERKDPWSVEQRVEWSDRKGFKFCAQVEIVDFSIHYYDPPEKKVFHATTVDSEGNVVKLFYLVGENKSNAPVGFYYSETAKRHIKEEVKN